MGAVAVFEVPARTQCGVPTPGRTLCRSTNGSLVVKCVVPAVAAAALLTMIAPVLPAHRTTSGMTPAVGCFTLDDEPTSISDVNCCGALAIAPRPGWSRALTGRRSSGTLGQWLDVRRTGVGCESSEAGAARVRREVAALRTLAFISVVLGAVPTVAPASGELLYTLVSPNPEITGGFGRSVSGAGDVNNDGYPDLLVGAPYEDPGASPISAGRAYLFSGAAGGLLYTLASPDEEGDGEFGVCVSGIGDVNNDGHADVVVGAYQEDPGGSPEDAGRAHVFSGSTGAVLYTLVSPNEQFRGWFGGSVSGAGDVNDDGCTDVVVGACKEGTGKAYVFSGQTGNVLHTFSSPTAWRFGASVSGAGDVDNDGYDDLVIGAPEESPGSVLFAGRAYVFSGQTGGLLYTLASPNEQSWGWFGGWVSAAGDADGDGCGDVVAGASGENPGGSPNGAGRAYVFSGQTALVLHTLASPNEETWGGFGGWVSGAGDVDVDGYDDVIVGATGESPGSAPDAAGRAYVFDGQTGALMYTFASPNEQNGGVFGTVCGAGDVNNAGYADVIVGAHGEGAGRAYVFAPEDVAVELTSFRAEAKAGRVRLVWMTLTEKDNLGFNLDRAPTEIGPYARLNENLIPGAGTTTVPQTYSYVDDNVEAGCAYWYRLEDVSLAGERTLHGPVEAVVPGRPGLGLEVLEGAEPGFVMRFSGPGRASLKLYDVSGRLMAVLWEGQAGAGEPVTVYPETCRTLPPGQYWAALTQGGETARRSVTIAR